MPRSYPVSIASLLLYFLSGRAVAQRTNELLQLYHSSQSKDRAGDISEHISVIGQGPAAPAGSTIINIDPPVIGDEDDSEDEDGQDESVSLQEDEEE